MRTYLIALSLLTAVAAENANVTAACNALEAQHNETACSTTCFMTTVTRDAAGGTPEYEVTFATCSASETVCNAAKLVAEELETPAGVTNTYKCEAATDNTCPETTCGETSSSGNELALGLGLGLGLPALLGLGYYFMRKRRENNQNVFTGEQNGGTGGVLQPEYNGLRNAV